MAVVAGETGIGWGSRLRSALCSAPALAGTGCKLPSHLMAAAVAVGAASAAASASVVAAAVLGMEQSVQMARKRT